MTDLSLYHDAYTRVTYLAEDLPVRAVDATLSEFRGYHAPCHEHEDLEFLLVNEGEMRYFVNGRVLTLRRGEGIFVNARRMHYGFSETERECLYTCVLVHPRMLGDTDMPMARYAARLTSEGSADALVLSPAEHAPLLRLLRDIAAVGQTRADYFMSCACKAFVRFWWKPCAAPCPRARPTKVPCGTASPCAPCWRGYAAATPTP